MEGIAGNDREIITTYPPEEDFTAAYVINNTGFGIMTLRDDSLTYDHVIYKNPFEAKDHWQIMFNKNNRKPSTGNLRMDVTNE